jgi:alpha-glucosidase (family GH31 glycosyl hydrolase)
LPSPPPIFLRGGKLILTNKPATRVSHLNNQYTLIAALENQKAIGTFLGIKNFTNNAQIDACEIYGCAIEIKITYEN